MRPSLSCGCPFGGLREHKPADYALALPNFEDGKVWGSLYSSLCAEKCVSVALGFKSQIEGGSQRMLAATLKSLERDGILRRGSDRDRPRGSGYVLTPLGASMLLALEGFISFTMAQWSSIEASRRSYDNGDQASRVRAQAASRVSAATRSPQRGLLRTRDCTDRGSK
jgi:DNA-binding HxlR family transcriptional regulator